MNWPACAPARSRAGRLRRVRSSITCTRRRMASWYASTEKSAPSREHLRVEFRLERLRTQHGVYLADRVVYVPVAEPRVAHYLRRAALVGHERYASGLRHLRYCDAECLPPAGVQRETVPGQKALLLRARPLALHPCPAACLRAEPLDHVAVGRVVPAADDVQVHVVAERADLRQYLDDGLDPASRGRAGPGRRTRPRAAPTAPAGTGPPPVGTPLLRRPGGACPG